MTPSPKTPAPVRNSQGRVKSYTPPIVPGHHHGYSKRSVMEKEKPKGIDYFAGAKFDCLPSVSSLPTPPSEWTIPVLRSQSQPSSPVTTGVRIDLNSLFLTPQVTKISAVKRDFKEAGLKKQHEMDTHPKNVNKVEIMKTPVDSSNGYAKNSNNSKTCQQTSGKVESTKPIDITPRRLSSQPKQLYPHLTEHLKCLLKVQG